MDDWEESCVRELIWEELSSLSVKASLSKLSARARRGEA